MTANNPQLAAAVAALGALPMPVGVRPIADLDVPLPVLTLQVAAARTHSPSDRIAYAIDEWLITHPDAPVSTEADYPDFHPGGAL